jgi:hypothetical protein
MFTGILEDSAASIFQTLIALKMETAHSSETSVNYYSSTQGNIPDGMNICMSDIK